MLLEKDAAGYVGSEPGVAAASAAIGAAGNDPAKLAAAWQGYVTASLTAQEHLGVPGSLQHVLPLAQAQMLADKLMAPDVDVKQQMVGLAQQYGTAWPHVFADLVTLGKLPGGYLSVGALEDPRDAALLSRGLNEQSKSGREWNDILGNAGGRSVAQGIRDAVRNDTTVMQFERSLKDSGSSLHQIDGILQAIETLAFAKRFYNQDSNAAQSAIKAFTDRYAFMGGSSSARVPKDKYEAVAANAAEAMNGLTEASVQIPPSYGATPGAPARGDYIHALRANPTWVTSPREDAVWLLDHEGAVVRDPAGKPFAVPFAKSAPPRAMVPQFGVGTP